MRCSSVAETAKEAVPSDHRHMAAQIQRVWYQQKDPRETIEVHRCLLASITKVLGDLETHKMRFDVPVASPSRCARSHSC